MTRLGLAAALVLGAAGCASTPAKPPAAPAAQSSSPSPSPSTSQSGLVVAAVVRHSPQVRLYQVGAGRTARPVWSVPPPEAGLVPIRTTLDAGPTPDLCVLWGTVGSDGGYGGVTIRCYRYGSTTGVALPVSGTPFGVALAADGSAVLWQATTGSASNGVESLSTARFDHGSAADVRRFVTASGTGFTTWGCRHWVTSALWLDDSRLVLQCGGENDEPGGLAIENLLPRKGSETRPGRPLDDYSLEAPGGVIGDRIATLERTHCPSDGIQPCPDAAVTAPAGGGPARPVATPLAGRTVTSISGGADGVLYVTDVFGHPGADSPRVYLEYPSDAAGLPVTGLPKDIRLIALQP